LISSSLPHHSDEGGFMPSDQPTPTESPDREWGKLNAGQTYGILAIDIDRAFAVAGLREYEQTLVQAVREHSWGVSTMGKKRGHSWPDAAPARLDLVKLAAVLGVPFQRLYEARSRLLKMAILLDGGGTLSINKDACLWLHPSTGAPLLSPAKLAYAASAMTRNGIHPEPCAFTPNREKSSSLDSRQTVKTESSAFTPFRESEGSAFTPNREESSRQTVNPAYKERGRDEIGDEYNTPPNPPMGGSGAGDQSNPQGIPNLPPPAAPPAPPLEVEPEKFPGAGRNSPEATALSKWAERLGNNWYFWVTAKCDDFPAEWIKAALKTYVDGMTQPKGEAYILKVLGNWKAGGGMPVPKLYDEPKSATTSPVPEAQPRKKPLSPLYARRGNQDEYIRHVEAIKRAEAEAEAKARMEGAA
jgi:hypothetical protein